MKRAPLLCVILLAGAASSACDIPSAVFDGGTTSGTTTTTSSTSDGGGAGQTTATHPGGSGGTTTTGGGGAGGSSTGGTGGSTTSSSTTLTGPTVTCNYPNLSECAPGQVCCYDINGTTDACGPPGSCDPPSDYVEVKCDQNADCPAGKTCCAYFTGTLGGSFTLEKTYCDTSCDLGSQETPACQDDFDCDYPVFTCQGLFGAAYPDTKFCLSAQ